MASLNHQRRTRKRDRYRPRLLNPRLPVAAPAYLATAPRTISQVEHMLSKDLSSLHLGSLPAPTPQASPANQNKLELSSLSSHQIVLMSQNRNERGGRVGSISPHGQAASIRQAIQPSYGLKERKKKGGSKFKKRKLEHQKHGELAISGEPSDATVTDQTRLTEVLIAGSPPCTTEERKAIEEDGVPVCLMFTIGEMLTLTNNKNEMVVTEHGILDGGHIETPISDIEVSVQIAQENRTADGASDPETQHHQDVSLQSIKLEGKEAIGEALNESHDGYNDLETDEENFRIQGKFGIAGVPGGSSFEDGELESDDEFYDARSIATENDVVVREHKPTVQTSEKVVLSKEILGLILEELYNIESQPGLTFNVPSSFRNYRLVSQTFNYYIASLAYRHIELHNRTQRWNTSAIWADMKVNEVLMGEDIYFKFRHTQEITIPETSDANLGHIPEIMLGCKNLKDVNWICLWRTNGAFRSPVKDLPNDFQTILCQSPNIHLHLWNFTLPFLEEDILRYLKTVPLQNLVSLELAIDDWEISRPIRDFLVSAKNLKTLRLAPHGTSSPHFDSDGGRLPPIKDLYLEQYSWASHTFPRNVADVWCLSELEHLTMDDVSLVHFLMVVEDVAFPQLRTLVVRDPSTNPEKVPTILSGLYTLVSSAINLKELDVWYRADSLFYGPKGELRGKGNRSRPTFQPLIRLHVLRGVDGVSNILDAILVAGQ